MHDDNIEGTDSLAGIYEAGDGVQKRAGAKENVLFLGLQKIPRGATLVLVNNEMGSTVAYNPEKHNIINMDGYVRFVLGVYTGER